jgi:hypothetical protein
MGGHILDFIVGVLSLSLAKVFLRKINQSSYIVYWFLKF